MASRKRTAHLTSLLKTFIWFFCFKVCYGFSTEYQPWLGNTYEFELRASLLYQDYSWISSNGHLKKFSSNDLFLNTSLSNTYYNFGLEIEAIGAKTRRQKCDLDQFKITGRYIWLDDVAGDPLSFTTGLSLIFASSPALKDVSSFHHGKREGEFFVSIGKEKPLETLWGSRWWSILGIGIAERGSPWLRFHLTYEKRLRDHLEMQIFLRSLWGFGHHNIHVHHFHGYGPIQHQSIDLGLRYTYFIQYFGNLSLEYSYRVHAHNFPIYAHRLLLEFLYTFGL